MRKSAMYLLLLCAVIINIYLIFYWEPQNKVINQEKVSKETLSYSKPIYKLEMETVLEQLSSDDRKDFEKIIKKLSTFDIGKIKEYYENSNEEESIKNIYRLLKKRLTTEDYKRIEKNKLFISRFIET
jgi:predicted Zn-dependent protease